ncbi:flavoprotein [Ancylobacter radicis]|uniref:Flavoprotein n=1 Tax=Ancylobacter radicis TaxID=2836179 RepID=A0ABS5RB27_9HYPH|nr:flavoprotein [Ancylobacter radicis]MBS9478869.1 flavoprotein [Ancylobacter radicis]
MSADKGTYPRWAWALTGSGHFFTESIALIQSLDAVDLFVSRAADEVLRMYKQDLPKNTRIFKETTASSAPVGRFYEQLYHTLVVSPASSNTVAKAVYGISDTLVTNCFAQAGKCRVHAIVFACDTAPEMITMAPGGEYPVYPRRIDLENTARLKEFDDTTVVESLADLDAAIGARRLLLAERAAPVDG